MPLPTDAKTPWPLPGVSRAVTNELAEHAAWFSGEPDRLRRFYGGRAAGQGDPPSRGGRFARRFKQFWSRGGVNDPLGQGRMQLHVPLAGDIATLSADLLFSEPPTFTVEDTTTQDRLVEIVEEAGIHARLLEAAEVAAGTSGVYLRPVWDVELTDHPLLAVVAADQAIPEFRFGVLTGVTFWRELERDGAKVIRELERHEPGVYFIGVYEGTDQTLGRKIALTDRNETKHLADIVDEGDEVRVEGWDASKGMFVRYVPNIMPNRRHRGYLGRSDYQGIEGLFDALDETYTSLMRDIRLGKARLLVDAQYLQRTQNPQDGAMFDLDQEAFTPIKRAPTDESTKGITDVQFDIRTQDHLDAAKAITTEAVTKAGYASQSFMPENEGRAESGTALEMRERKSFMTQGKKRRYFKTPTQDILEIMLFLDKAVFNNNHEVQRPSMEYGDSIAETTAQVAETIQMLRNAEAASIQTRVQMLHPDWDDTQVEGEVARIQAETGSSVPDLLPGEGEG